MKLLHTSDWHLGQIFYTKSRKSEHQQFINWLITQIDKQQPDAVVVAGDLFDTGTPPSYARELYNEFVVAISHLNCQLILMAGNHDSVAMLNESRQLLARLNTRVIANPTDQPEQQIIEIKSNNGEISGIICAIPFIRPRDLVQSQAGKSELEKQQALIDAITDHYDQLYQLAKARADSLPGFVPVICTGHLAAAGGKTTESVRDVYIGTLAGFPTSHFPPADYIALGHIHRAQNFGDQNHIRYSGSPIALSFDEIDQPKSITMVEFDQSGDKVISEIAVPEFQPMAHLTGTPAQIEQQLARYADADPDLPVWLSIEVKKQDYLSDLQQLIAEMAADMPVEILQLKRQRPNYQASLSAEDQETLNELTPSEVFQKRLNMEGFDDETGPAQQERLINLFHQILADTVDGSDESPESKTADLSPTKSLSESAKPEKREDAGAEIATILPEKKQPEKQTQVAKDLSDANSGSFRGAQGQQSSQKTEPSAATPDQKNLFGNLLDEEPDQ